MIKSEINLLTLFLGFNGNLDSSRIYIYADGARVILLIHAALSGTRN